MTTTKSLIPVFGLGLLLCLPVGAAAQSNSDCLSCHGDKGLTGKRDGATISLYVDSTRLAGSRHGPASCVDCHADLAKKELPHEGKLARATCLKCHAEEARQYAQSLHGTAASRGDALAPRCSDCHGSHDIVAAKDVRSPVLPSRVSSLCGACHTEGTAIHKKRELRQSDVPANFPEHIHGELAKKGLVVAATCVSCHSAHEVLPPTDDRSSIAQKNLASTCMQCHAKLADVHRKVIPVARWTEGPSAVPACVTCHAPHKSNAAGTGCLRCHERGDIKSSRDGHSLEVQSNALAGSVHAKLSCSQCHSSMDPSHERSSGNRAPRVDCSSCHAAVAQQYRVSTHGQLEAKQDKNAPSCAECHGTHDILGRKSPASPTFPLNIPTL